VEARVLGSLIEKEITTPDYYPLSLNAILNAANQKSNRDPAMDLDEDAVRRALQSLSQEGLARSAATDSRVPKFEHRLADVFNFHRHEIALFCVLLLRGPQTPGVTKTVARPSSARRSVTEGEHCRDHATSSPPPPLARSGAVRHRAGCARYR